MKYPDDANWRRSISSLVGSGRDFRPLSRNDGHDADDVNESPADLQMCGGAAKHETNYLKMKKPKCVM